MVYLFLDDSVYDFGLDINILGLSNAKAIHGEEQQWYYLTHSWR